MNQNSAQRTPMPSTPPRNGGAAYTNPPYQTGYVPGTPSASGPGGRVPASAASDSGADAPKKKKTSRDYAVSLLIKLGATAAAVTLLLTVFIGVFVCHSNSAYPMIKDGDLCITSRLSDPNQGDMIAYRENGAIRFGRVIACAGSTVEIMNDFIAVDGFGLYEQSVYPTTPEGASITFPYTVPDGCVFVLNDYRSDISDSRSLGGIPLSDVKGKVIIVMRHRGI